MNINFNFTIRIKLFNIWD